MLILNQGLHKGWQRCFMACVDDRCPQLPTHNRPQVVISVSRLRASEQQPLESNGTGAQRDPSGVPTLSWRKKPRSQLLPQGLQAGIFLGAPPACPCAKRRDRATVPPSHSGMPCHFACWGSSRGCQPMRESHCGHFPKSPAFSPARSLETLWQRLTTHLSLLRLVPTCTKLCRYRS